MPTLDNIIGSIAATLVIGYFYYKIRRNSTETLFDKPNRLTLITILLLCVIYQKTIKIAIIYFVIELYLLIRRKKLVNKQ